MFETRLLFMDYGYQEMAKIDIKITNDEKCSWNSPKEQRVAIIVKELGKVYEIVNVIKIS